MPPNLVHNYDRLFAYCSARGFAGHDPFDGLNSRLFQMSPLKHFAATRLGWLQLIKRSAYDLRPILRVAKGVNPKGLALFALAELARFRASGIERHGDEARRLLSELDSVAIVGRFGERAVTRSFGYNFDWQSRVFYAPKGTPAIVPTAFASQAYIEAYEEFGDETYLKKAQEICVFVLTELNLVVETDDEICFSYTPLDRSVIYNASLLAGECLVRVGAIAGNDEYLDLATKAARFVIRRQRNDGAWVYGENTSQGWADNFHTAYILLSLKRISDAVPGLSDETHDPVRKGTEYWLNNFFLEDGTPKYYDTKVYPVDIHSAAVAIATLAELCEQDNRMLPLARKIAEWVAANMLDADGSFYYQKRKNSTVKTPFMRWGQAWMAYAIARLIEAESR
jgi:hypothetical protein